MYRVTLVVAGLGWHLTLIWMFEHLAQLPSQAPLCQPEQRNCGMANMIVIPT